MQPGALHEGLRRDELVDQIAVAESELDLTKLSDDIQDGLLEASLAEYQ